MSFFQDIEAVIFDCDGVLVDTEYLKFLAWKEALASKQIEFAMEEYIPLVGHSSKNILRAISQLKNRDISEDIIALRNQKYRLLQLQGVPSIPAMGAFVRQLAQEKGKLRLKLGLASSAPTEEIMRNLKQIHLEDIFDAIVSGSDGLNHYVDAEGKNKPKPYIYIETAKQLHVAPSSCLVFEDTAAGVQAAVGAGMIVVAVPNSFTASQDFSKAAKVLSSYDDLPVREILRNY